MGIIVFIAICAAANFARGGHLDNLLDITGNTLIRICSALVVAAGAVFLPDASLLDMIIVGVGFYLFFLPGWGAWFDIGTKEPEPGRGEQPMRWVYDIVSQRFGDAWGDFAAMVARGCLSIVVFLPLTLINGGVAVGAAVIFAVQFALIYVAAHRYKILPYPDVATGALFGLMVALHV